MDDLIILGQVPGTDYQLTLGDISAGTMSVVMLFIILQLVRQRNEIKNRLSQLISKQESS